MARELVLAIDQGTTGSTALLIDKSIGVVGQKTLEFPNYYPAPGQVEHDVADIWQSVGAAVGGALAMAGARGTDIVAIGITNQRETSLFWDRNTGEPIHRALVWQDRRTANRCAQLKEDGHEERIKRQTGLVLDPYFAGTKAEWLLDNVDGARARAEAGELAFGTIDSWLAHRLTGAHVTDASNASRTLLYDLNTRAWSDELCALFRVPRVSLPEVVDSSGVVGHTKNVGFLPDGIPVAGLIGDQQGALFGQACFDVGMAKCTYGTGAFILLNTGKVPTFSQHGMLTTVAWQVDGETTYALEGSAFIAGAAVQWLRDGLGIIQDAAQVEALARSVPNSGGVTFVPALAGLGAPYWRPEARGIICGLTGGTTRAHIARATLEGIALQIDDILRAMTSDLGKSITEVRVDGGAAKNDLLMQIQADLLGVPCVRPTVLETTGLGSGLLAGLATGMWSDQSQVSDAWREGRSFIATRNPHALATLRQNWRAAVEKA